MSDIVSLAELTDALVRLGYPDSAAGFHGVLCGSLCVADPGAIALADLLEAAQEGMAPDSAMKDLFDRLRQQSLQALMSADMDFAPLLPEDEAPLAERVQALADWCEGFLYGLASRRSLELTKASPEAREMIADLTGFTQAGAEGDAETEETAYSELVEYVRVGAQLLFMEFHPRGGSDSQTLH